MWAPPSAAMWVTQRGPSPWVKSAEEDARLIRVTEESFFEGLKQAVAGNKLGDISHAVQSMWKKWLSVIRDYTGHGVGQKMHEDPSVPQLWQKRQRAPSQMGLTIALEPMVAGAITTAYIA